MDACWGRVQSTSCRAMSGEARSSLISTNKPAILGRDCFLLHCVGCSDTKPSEKGYFSPSLETRTEEQITDLSPQRENCLIIILSPASQRNEVTSWAASRWLFFQQKLCSVWNQNPKAFSRQKHLGRRMVNGLKQKYPSPTFFTGPAEKGRGGRTGTERGWNNGWLYNGSLSAREASGATMLSDIQNRGSRGFWRLDEDKMATNN